MSTAIGFSSNQPRKASGTEVTEGKIDHSRYVEVAAKLTERFKFKSVAITLRESGLMELHDGEPGNPLERLEDARDVHHAALVARCS